MDTVSSVHGCEQDAIAIENCRTVLRDDGSIGYPILVYIACHEAKM